MNSKRLLPLSRMCPMLGGTASQSSRVESVGRSVCLSARVAEQGEGREVSLSGTTIYQSNFYRERTRGFVCTNNVHLFTLCTPTDVGRRSAEARRVHGESQTTRSVARSFGCGNNKKRALAFGGCYVPPTSRRDVSCKGPSSEIETLSFPIITPPHPKNCGWN